MQKEHIKKVAWFLREVAGLLDTALSDDGVPATVSKPASEPVKTADKEKPLPPQPASPAETAFQLACQDQDAEEADEDEEFADEDEEEENSGNDEIPEEFRSDGTVCGRSDSSDDDEHHRRRSVIDRHSVDAEILGVIQQSMPRGTLFSDISAKVHYPDHIIRQSLRRLKSVHIRDDGSRPKTYTMKQRWG